MPTPEFEFAHQIVAEIVEMLTDNDDLDVARDQDNYPLDVHTAAVGALYALRDQLAELDPVMSSVLDPCDCGGEWEPLDVLEGKIECDVPPDHLDPATGAPAGYEPSGTTEMLWDTTQSIGVVCAVCGQVSITKRALSLAGTRYVAV